MPRHDLFGATEMVDVSDERRIVVSLRNSNPIVVDTRLRPRIEIKNRDPHQPAFNLKLFSGGKGLIDPLQLDTEIRVAHAIEVVLEGVLN